MAFDTVQPGEDMNSINVRQIIEALDGTAGAGQVIALTQVNDSSNYALTVRNLDTSNGYILRCLDATDTVMLAVTESGLTLSGITMGAWNTFTPTFDQGGAVATSAATGAYAVIGKTALVQCALTASAAGTGANNILLASLPAAIAPKTPNVLIGSGLYNDAGALYTLVAVRASASTIHFYGYNTTDEFGVNPAITIASGDVMHVQLAYEIA